MADHVVPEADDINWDNEDNVGPMPRAPVDYPHCVCQSTIPGRMIQCPSPKNCQHFFHTQCLTYFNEREDKLVCPSCEFLLSPRGWYKYYIRKF